MPAAADTLAGDMAKGRANKISRESVLDAASAVLEREGVDALTMRRLAAETGTTPMAFYNHFADRDAILEALVSRLFERVPIPPDRGPWDKRIRAMGEAMLRCARHSPVTFRVAMTRPAKPLSARPMSEFTLRALRDAGLGERAVQSTYGVLGMFVRGLLLYEVEQACLPAAGESEAGPSVASQTDLLFDAGVRLLCDGIRAAAKPAKSAKSAKPARAQARGAKPRA
jgi:AcrR family transcriptional regulator